MFLYGDTNRWATSLAQSDRTFPQSNRTTIAVNDDGLRVTYFVRRVYMHIKIMTLIFRCCKQARKYSFFLERICVDPVNLARAAVRTRRDDTAPSHSSTLSQGDKNIEESSLV